MFKYLIFRLVEEGREKMGNDIFQSLERDAID